MKRKISFKLIVYMIAMLTFIYASCYTTFATGETPQEAIDPVQSDVVPSEASEAPSEITPEPQSSEEPDVPSEEEPVSSEVIYDPSENPSENESTEPIESSEVSSEIDVSYDPIESDEPTQSEDVPVYSEPEYSYPENTSHDYTTSYDYPQYDPGMYNPTDVVASLYDVSTVVDSTELKADDWNIILDLDNKGGGNANVGLTDFNFIKNNSNNDSNGDDGQWILYTGYGLLALGARGILYVFISIIYRIKHKDEYDEMIKQSKSEAKAKKKADKRALKASKYSAG